MVSGDKFLLLLFFAKIVFAYGLSLAFLEALASGLICVTTRCTGTTEVIQDGYNGFLVDKSMAAVKEGIDKALKLSWPKKEEISRNAAQFVREHFEIEKNIAAALKTLDIPVKG